MTIAIIEDEPATARNLEFMLKEIDSAIKVTAILGSISEAVAWLKLNQQKCDLLFMDIQLSDGLSFEIFKETKVDPPVIFVTAFNEYSLQAFKSNGIDYVLKPFEESELQNALNKFKKLKSTHPAHSLSNEVLQLLSQLKQTPNYKRSFLIQYKDKLIPVQSSQLAWFYTENELVYAQTFENKQYIIDLTLENLQEQLDPADFFRANRQFIINRSAILEAEVYFNGRLLIKVKPLPNEQILVSKARVPEFKSWLNS
jgi:two-component system, LytTR family, response regulator LytT